MQASQRRDRSRSRSPNRGSGWGDRKSRERSRSPSAERYRAPLQVPVGRSFHESMMACGRSAGDFREKVGGSYDDCQKDWEKERSPRGWQGDGKSGDRPHANNGEEEEGMFPEGR